MALTDGNGSDMVMPVQPMYGGGYGGYGNGGFGGDWDSWIILFLIAAMFGGFGGGASYARGRNARRDSRGRYSRENRGRSKGYSREGENEEMIQELRELMNEAFDMQTRQAFNNFIEKLESM